MNKVLIVTTIPETLTTFLLPFAKHFRSQGWQIDAMACGVCANAQCIENFDRVWDVEWSRNPLDPRNLLVTPSTIRKIVAQEKYDIVHVHTPVAAFVTRYALRNLRKRLGTKVIYTAHGFHFHPGGKRLKNAVFVALEKIAGTWTDEIVVINTEDQKAAIRHNLVSSFGIHYMPGIGVDLNYYSPEKIQETDIQRVRQELGLEPDIPLFLSVAELNPGKRHRDIIRAVAHLNRRNICVAFAGEGPLLEDLKQLAHQMKVQDQIRFLGFRRDITTWMRASVATVLASEREGLPRSIMESMSLGIPVIGTDIRGIQDLLARNSGILFPVGDAEKLAAKIAWVMDNPQEAQQIGKRGQERIINYDLRHIIKLHETLYSAALSLKSPQIKQFSTQSR
ncbi:glycosyltransferase family 4 protein [Plectonema cf. radiosum LEGE 06105]|uniref:Glycosyltransferase family 4 protein n=1 Tax=Plectonema cf. radiosum LEGE 06105 TaxID=945769 RepID=A0A8J7JVF4_9CYAN|nr:glycosyltransferase family 4 protein [Plectonema radiosum]MBE9214540.1 glycosyltransferase family 4 protein [Plectonema cf. radiosum LEGE 06105]